MKNKNNEQMQKILKIATIITCFLLLIILGIYAYYFFFTEEMPYFFEHFARPIGLLGVGIIALILPYLGNKSTYAGDNKGDLLMKITGIFLIVAAILTLIVSFI